MWEERKLVLMLKKYRSCDDLSHQGKIDAVKDGADRGGFIRYFAKMKYNSDFPKNRLTGKSGAITEENRDEWEKIRDILDECVEDGYIKEEITESTFLLLGEEKTVYHKLLITSKGKKLIRWNYFYLKFLPEEFGDLKIVLITILGTIITSPIWKPILSILNRSIKIVLDKLL
jgi:hypothetical protein